MSDQMSTLSRGRRVEESGVWAEAVMGAVCADRLPGAGRCGTMRA